MELLTLELLTMCDRLFPPPQVRKTIPPILLDKYTDVAFKEMIRGLAIKAGVAKIQSKGDWSYVARDEVVVCVCVCGVWEWQPFRG